jgi:hypothetical protein
MPRRGSTYDSAWERVRKLALERDGYRCRINGPKCETVANQGDHIVPVDAGGRRLDLNNIRASCGPCNSGRAARSKHREGWRRAATRIVLVVGPPGSGKSTLVSERAGPSDVVVDYDLLAEALGGGQHGSGKSEAATKARGAVLTALRRGELDAPRAWIVSANPKAESMFPHHEVEVVDPGRVEVLRRCREAGRPGEWAGLVDDWYSARSGPVGASREW